MTEHTLFETRLRTALARHVADAPMDFDALGFARTVAAAEPRRRGRLAAIAAVLSGRPWNPQWWGSRPVPPSGRTTALRVAWIVAIVGLLLAAVASAIFVGSELLRRSSNLTVVRPALTLTLAHPGHVTAVAWSPEGTHLATGASTTEHGRDGDRTRATVRVWDAGTGDEVLFLEQKDAKVDRLAYSPDGTRLAIAGFTPVLHDRATGRGLPGQFPEFLAYSPDGTRIAVGGAWGWSAILDATTGATQLELPSGPSWLWDAAWSPDGTRLATTYGASIRVWDAATGDRLLTLEGYLDGDDYDQVVDVAWSPDGTRIAAAGEGVAKVWDASTGARLLTLEGRTAIEWSPDGTLLASVGADGVARILDAASGDEVARLTGHALAVTAVAWSPDGSRVATASLDGTARVWQVGPPLAPSPSDTPTPMEEVDQRALVPLGGPTESDTELGTITWQIYRGHAPDLGTPHGPVGIDRSELLWLGPGGTVERTALPEELWGLIPVGDGLIGYWSANDYGHGQAWTISWDGDRWVVGDPLDVPPTLFGSNGTDVRAVTGPRGVLIVGYDVAVAADGQHFVAATQRPGGGDATTGRIGPVLATADGFIALVSAGQARFAVGPVFEPLPWFSADGLTWTPAASASPFGEGSWVQEVAGRDGRFVAVGNTSQVDGPWTVWVSDDGLTWERVPGLGLGGDQSCAATDSHCPISVTASDAGWVISTGKHQALWTSADGRSWEPLAVPGITIEEPWGFLPPLALCGDTVVVVGSLESGAVVSAVGTFEP